MKYKSKPETCDVYKVSIRQIREFTKLPRAVKSYFSLQGFRNHYLSRIPRNVTHVWVITSPHKLTALIYREDVLLKYYTPVKRSTLTQ